MSKSPAAENLGVHVRKEIIAEVEKRAAGIDKKKGTYAALILEKWFADGCPPVTEADRLVQLAKAPNPPKRITNPKAIDPWNLDPGAFYILEPSDLLDEIVPKLGIDGMLFDLSAAGRKDILVAYDNHPTHWIVLAPITGLKRHLTHGLFIEAHPKDTVPRHEIENILRKHAGRIGMEIRGPVKLTQLPTIS
ncbi:MAG: hypothetical protein RL376_812 [Verrucomicrobiota bacterium]|jgi:hypothetical protein